MKFLVDASMSPVVVQELRGAGHDAVHVGEGLRLDAPDTDILEHAARDARVIVAADTDFGELLARRGTAEPSVVLFHRQADRRPREQAALLLANLPSVEGSKPANLPSNCNWYSHGRLMAARRYARASETSSSNGSSYSGTAASSSATMRALSWNSARSRPSLLPNSV